MVLKKGYVFPGFILVLIGIILVSSLNIVSGADGDVKSPTSIPDFIFERNSDWNDAFNILDYYEISGHPSGYSFAEDPTNVDGEFIAHEFTIGGGVRFKPVADFIGSRNFMLIVEDINSNIFKVTIVADLNASLSNSSGDENIKYGSQAGVTGRINWIFLTVIILIIVLLVGFAFWFFKMRKKGDDIVEEAPVVVNNKDVPAASTSKTAPTSIKEPSQDAINEYYKKNKIK